MSRQSNESNRISLAQPSLGPREKRRVNEVLDSGMLASGEETRTFEREFASLCDATHGVATNNGTTALHTALHALGVGDGDRVITTPFSFIATANAIRFCGAEPIFVDIVPNTYAIDPDAVEQRLRAEDDVAAIVAVHLYGLPAQMAALTDLADAHDVALVEDAAQAHAAEYKNRRVGPIGDVGCFSFYPTKNMTTGEGGMIVTDSERVAQRASRFIDHGRRSADKHVDLGHNFRMTDIAAAIGRVQLEKLPTFVERRRENATRLTDDLTDSPVEPPVEPDDRRHVYHQYTIRTSNREALRKHLDDFGVDTGIYYPTPIHHQPAYSSIDESLPVAERAAETVLSLPVHPGLSEQDCRKIIHAIGCFNT